MNGPTTGETTPLERGNMQGDPEPGNAEESAAGEGEGVLLGNLAFVTATIWLPPRLRRAQAAWRSG